MAKAAKVSSRSVRPTPYQTASPRKRATTSHAPQPSEATSDAVEIAIESTNSTRTSAPRPTLATSHVQAAEPHHYRANCLLALPNELLDEIWAYTFDGAETASEFHLLLTCRKVYHLAKDIAFNVANFKVDLAYVKDFAARRDHSFKVAMSTARRAAIGGIVVPIGTSCINIRRLFTYDIKPSRVFIRYELQDVDNIMIRKWSLYLFIRNAHKVHVRHLTVQHQELRGVKLAFGHVLYAAAYSNFLIIIAPMDVVKQDLRKHQHVQCTLQNPTNMRDPSSLNVRFEYRTCVDTQTLEEECTELQEICAYWQMKARKNLD